MANIHISDLESNSPEEFEELNDLELEAVVGGKGGVFSSSYWKKHGGGFKIPPIAIPF